MAYTNTWAEHGLLRKFTGIIDPEELLKSNFELQAHPKFADIKYIINDFTSVTEIIFGEEYAKVYASTDDIISDTKGKLKIAIVVEREEHIVLANSYRRELKNQHFICEVFETIKEADDWVKN